MDKQGLQLDKPSFLEGQPTGWVGGELIHLLYGGLIPDSLGLQAPVPTPAAFSGRSCKRVRPVMRMMGVLGKVSIRTRFTWTEIKKKVPKNEKTIIHVNLGREVYASLKNVL
jgi:hypothetical protein